MAGGQNTGRLIAACHLPIRHGRAGATTKSTIDARVVKPCCFQRDLQVHALFAGEGAFALARLSRSFISYCDVWGDVGGSILCGGGLNLGIRQRHRGRSFRLGSYRIKASAQVACEGDETVTRDLALSAVDTQHLFGVRACIGADDDAIPAPAKRIS